MEKRRTVYFDCLRVLATLGVIIIHVTSFNWGKVSVSSFDWQVLNFYNGIVRFAVPCFVMISGALFLERDVDYKKNTF